MQLYDSYMETLKGLTQRIQKLSREIAEEPDAGKAHALKVRRALLERECGDLRSIAQALKTRSVWGEFY